MNNITDDDIANILHSEGWNITIRDFLEKLFGIERTIYILGRASALNRGELEVLRRCLAAEQRLNRNLRIRETEEGK